MKKNFKKSIVSGTVFYKYHGILKYTEMEYLVFYEKSLTDDNEKPVTSSKI